MRIKCTAISDTHTFHEDVELDGGDILFHAGDATFTGQPDEVYPFLTWLSEQPYEEKVLIAGNHDFGWEPVGQGIPCDLHGTFIFRGKPLKKGLEEEYREAAKDLGIIYLDNQLATIDGLRIFGSPEQPAHQKWAFNTSKYEAEHVCNAFPANLDVLMTHGPALGIRDKVKRRSIFEGIDLRVGCESIKKYVKEHKPRYHIHGHIHEGYGRTKGKDTETINASICQRNYRDLNEPINFYIKGK